MAHTDTPHALHWEDAALWVAARVEDIEGGVVVRADVTSVTLKVFDRDGGNVVTLTQTLVVAGALFDTLQTADPRWTEDAVGYNFAHVIPASAFPKGDRRYRCEFVFDPASGDNFPFVVRVTTSGLLSS